MGICVFIIPLFKLYICNFHNTETKKFKNKQTKKKQNSEDLRSQVALFRRLCVKSI